MRIALILFFCNNFATILDIFVFWCQNHKNLLSFKVPPRESLPLGGPLLDL